MHNNIETILEKIADKYRRAIPAARELTTLPYRSENGRWLGSPTREDNSWWTTGFWSGILWQFYNLTKDEAFLQEARRGDEEMAKELRRYIHLNHDMAFMYLLSCGAEYQLIGTEQARIDALHSASLLQGRFNPAGFINVWNGAGRLGWAIIDCLMNLPLLFWATRQLGDPRFENAAKVHAETTLNQFFREDGSVSHIVEFNPYTGERVAEHPGQGYALGSSWSRGQAWAVYGFAMMYMNTKDERYLDAARRVSAYFIDHIRPDGLTDVDFCQPAEPEKIDNIAAAVAACGFIELSKLTGDPLYREQAERLLDALIDHCADFGDEHLGLLTHCTASYHTDPAGFHTNIIYGDYFLVEALVKLLDKDPFFWQAGRE